MFLPSFNSYIDSKCSKISYKVIQHIYNNREKFNYEEYKWVKKGGAGYEKEFCKLLNWKFVNKRHWDAEFNDIKIELKKSQSTGIQVDEIRYAEEFLEINFDCLEDIITIFMEIYSKKSKKVGIKKIIVVKNEKIINLLKFDQVPNLTKGEYCEIIINRNNNIKDSLSFTHRLLYSDLIKVADAYIIFQ
jgi:hypothetical protein